MIKLKSENRISLNEVIENIYEINLSSLRKIELAKASILASIKECTISEIKYLVEV